MKIDAILEQTLLYDFYGELLTQRQRQIYESVVLEDSSLGEAAEEFGISRQGVHDQIRRCEKALREYEESLHLVERFIHIRQEIAEVEDLLGEIEHPDARKVAAKAIEKLKYIQEEL